MNTTEVAILGGAVLKKKRNGAVLKRRKNGEVPNRNLRISLNKAAGGTGFLRHSSPQSRTQLVLSAVRPDCGSTSFVSSVDATKKRQSPFFAHFVDKHAPVVLIEQYR